MDKETLYAYLIAWLIFVILIVIAIWLTAYINNRKLKKQLNRRNKKRPVERQAFEDCCLSCSKIKQYENVIKDLQNEIEYWKAIYQSEKIKCSLMQDTITKLRIVQNEKRK